LVRRDGRLARRLISVPLGAASATHAPPAGIST
jgi:hypothetical protein